MKICVTKTLEFMQIRKQRISISLTLSKRLQKFRELNHMKFKNPENWSNCFPKSTFFKTIWHVMLKTYQILHFQCLLVRKSFRERLFLSFMLFKAPGRNFFSHCCSHQVVYAINFPSKIKNWKKKSDIMLVKIMAEVQDNIRYLWEIFFDLSLFFFSIILQHTANIVFLSFLKINTIQICCSF